jgi:hypothetical protein
VAEDDLATLLERLVEAAVDLVVVGGIAAVSQGAPVTTFDLDVVHQRTAKNVRRILGVLGAVGAHYRGRPELFPSEEALLGPGHHLLTTQLGPLDLLGAIEQGLDYEALLPDTYEVETPVGKVRVLSLSKIVDLKRASSHEKDRAMLPILEAALARRGDP